MTGWVLGGYWKRDVGVPWWWRWGRRWWRDICDAAMDRIELKATSPFRNGNISFRNPLNTAFSCLACHSQLTFHLTVSWSFSPLNARPPLFVQFPVNPAPSNLPITARHNRLHPRHHPASNPPISLGAGEGGVAEVVAGVEVGVGGRMGRRENRDHAVCGGEFGGLSQPAFPEAEEDGPASVVEVFGASAFFDEEPDNFDVAFANGDL